MKIYLDSVGCRLNQAEIERYAWEFRAAGHTLVASPQEADLAVVNTCTVTSAAASDSRQRVRQIARAGVEKIIATGCWTTIQPERAAALDGVTGIVPNLHKDHLVSTVLGLPQEDFELEPVEREPIPGSRQKTRAFIKVQDGCDNHCTFCITRIARGPARSRLVSQVLADIRAALNGRHAGGGEKGAREVVLTGVHLGSWGQDLSPPKRLKDLIQVVLKETDAPRLRLSSLEPWDLDEDFFGLWQNPRLCRHLHLPLQSGSHFILRRMARNTSPEDFAHIVESARRAIPGLAITTDVIVGFPGETEAHFEESMSFIRQMQFAGGHVFTFSERPGTPASRLPDSVPYPIRKRRNARMQDLFAAVSRAYQQKFIGKTLEALWESVTAVPGGWDMVGWTDNYLRVTVRSPRDLWNQITPAHLKGLQDGVFQAELLSS